MQASSILLSYHALRHLFNFLGVNFKVKLRKGKELQRYNDFGDIEGLIAQAKKSLREQTEEKKERNAALFLDTLEKRCHALIRAIQVDGGWEFEAVLEE